jgi:hypothetical protein
VISCAAALQPLAHAQVVGVQAGVAHALGGALAAVEPVMLLGQRVDLRQVHAQRAARVAQRAAGAPADDHGGQRGAFAAVLGVDVLDDLLAALVLEVDVDVGRLVALAGDEALEQHAQTRGVHLGHAQAVADRRVGRRAAPLAQDAAAARKTHQVVHGEEVHLVLQLGNQRQLVLDLLLHGGGHALRVTHAGALLGVVAQGLGGRGAGQHGFHGVLVAQLVQAEAAARGHHRRVGQQLGRVERGQAQARTQVRLGVGLQAEAALGHRCAQAHGGEHVVQHLARAHVHDHVTGSHQRHAGGPRLFKLREPQVVVQTMQQLGREPEIGAKLAPSQRQSVTECFQGDSASGEPVRRQDELAIGQAIGGDVLPAQAVLALGRGAPAGGDELAQRAPAVQVVRQRDQAKAPVAAVEHELAAGQQLEAELLGLGMRAHQPRHRAFIGDGQRAVAQRMGARHQFLGVRGADLEAEVGAAVQLRVGGKAGEAGGGRWGGLHDSVGAGPPQADCGPLGGQRSTRSDKRGGGHFTSSEQAMQKPPRLGPGLRQPLAVDPQQAGLRAAGDEVVAQRGRGGGGAGGVGLPPGGLDALRPGQQGERALVQRAVALHRQRLRRGEQPGGVEGVGLQGGGGL